MTTIKLGEVTVSRVIEIDRSSFPTTQMLPDSTAEAIARHRDWLTPFWDDRVGDLGSRGGGVRPGGGGWSRNAPRRRCHAGRPSRRLSLPTPVSLRTVLFGVRTM